MTSSARRLAGRLLSAFRSSLSSDPDERKSVMTLRGEIRELRAQVDRYEADERRIRQRTRRLRSVAVDSDHLNSILPLRVAAIRDAHDEAASAREEQFAALAEGYADAKRRWMRGERPPGVRTGSSGGLQWWIPADAGDEHSLSRRVERGWLPLHDIATVRACAVGGVMLDVGGNIGTTCIPRVALGDFECVYAAEPETENYACLVGNVIANGLTGRVLPERVAISSWDGAATLKRGERIGTHRLVASPTRAAGTLAEVPTLTLDSWIEKLGVSPAAVTFVKVDTQGWDVDVLEGASMLLAHKHIVWQLEITHMVKRSGRTLDRLWELLGKHFTHAKTFEAGSAAVKPIATAVAQLQSTLEERSFANLLLMNRA